ncbi:Vesicle-trafficking protein SEC22b-B [Thelohanellus kitauei]|uniref:Vesicle-trafficking protein SEC22b-B n=1 Tax=Thelohanellus kitauei TaxID=669202 RepID=A0A0C2JJV2_THEKT|nr:Vesicle-trafficking protein SEC22b-B [Thelohanellus kitauei]
MEKAKSNFTDTRKRRHYTSQLNEELQDVHKIMMQNIEGVLQRGETLSILDDKASKLKFQSDIYRKDARNLYLKSYLQKFGMYGIIGLILFILFIRYRYFG